MFKKFEESILSGDFAHYGEVINNHKATMQEQVVTTANKDNIHGEPHDTRLHVGGRLDRIWECHKPGFYKWLGLDRWTHYETCCKVGENEINVIDKFVWHDRKSCAENEYQVSAKGSTGLIRTNGQCTIQMAGLCWPIRGRVESAMKIGMRKSAMFVFDSFCQEHLGK